jgi:GNAT superfamily N-acetyltransferase
MESASIGRATLRDASLVADLIAHAFLDLPPAVWLVPERTPRRRVLAGQFRILVEHALQHGHIDLTADDTGAAVWFARLSPAFPPPPDYVPRLEVACGRWTDRFLVMDDLFDHHHPTAPHHHLAFLAVTPQRQRHGIGSALLERHHTRLDALGMPAYLETPTASNLEFYRRHGYTVGQPFYLPGGPPFWPMWREPRA